MKTINELHELVPTIIGYINSLDPEVGNDTPVEVYEVFEKDGWEVAVEFECQGEFENEYDNEDWLVSATLLKAWRKLTYLSVSHLDEKEDLIIFTEEELAPFFKEIDEAIADYEPSI
ncbi:MAG: hypothetical protein K2M69_05830 [Muribaculaceae bacterium]|nr:hypothetical protein [Muribaculaceae bacterium]